MFETTMDRRNWFRISPTRVNGGFVAAFLTLIYVYVVAVLLLPIPFAITMWLMGVGTMEGYLIGLFIAVVFVGVLALIQVPPLLQRTPQPQVEAWRLMPPIDERYISCYTKVRCRKCGEHIIYGDRVHHAVTVHNYSPSMPKDMLRRLYEAI